MTRLASEYLVDNYVFSLNYLLKLELHEVFFDELKKKKYTIKMHYFPEMIEKIVDYSRAKTFIHMFLYEHAVVITNTETTHKGE